jgi:hypothetical protein
MRKIVDETRTRKKLIANYVDNLVAFQLFTDREPKDVKWKCGKAASNKSSLLNVIHVAVER